MADPSTSPPLTRQSVAEAGALIRPLVHRTPTLRNATLTALASRRRDPGELVGTEWEWEREREREDDATATATATETETGEKQGEEQEEEKKKKKKKKRGRIRRTPAKPTIRLWFKCENLQRVGAFKARGAFHALERLKREPGWAEAGGRERGVVTHSSGESETKQNLPTYLSCLSVCLSVCLPFGFLRVPPPPRPPSGEKEKEV